MEGIGYTSTMGTKIAVINPDTSYGPAMQLLTEKQRGFVQALVHCGGRSADAYQAAGFAGNKTTARTGGYKLLHDPRILAAIREEADKTIRGGALIAATNLMNIVLDTNHKKNYEATIEMLNRTGMVVATKHEVEVTDNRSVDELKSYITSIAKLHGLEPSKLLGPNVIDAQYTEVNDPPAPPDKEDWETWDE